MAVNKASIIAGAKYVLVREVAAPSKVVGDEPAASAETVPEPEEPESVPEAAPPEPPSDPELEEPEEPPVLVALDEESEVDEASVEVLEELLVVLDEESLEVVEDSVDLEVLMLSYEPLLSEYL